MPCSSHTQVLGDMPQLQSLHLDCIEIGGHGISLEPGTFSQQLRGTPWLLHNISRLTALQHLEITDRDLDEHSPGQQLSALTASSELRTLKIIDAFGETPPLPPQALAHMFPAGKQMAHMQELHLEADLFMRAEKDTYVVCVTAEDIQRVCTACPGLQRLSLVNVAAADVVDSLRVLPESLWELELAGSALGDAVVSALTHLTGLQEMTWFSRNLKSAGLRQLGALRGLTRLMFANNERILAFDTHRCPDLDCSEAYGVIECELQTAAEVRVCYSVEPCMRTANAWVQLVAWA